MMLSPGPFQHLDVDDASPPGFPLPSEPSPLHSHAYRDDPPLLNPNDAPIPSLEPIPTPSQDETPEPMPLTSVQYELRNLVGRQDLEVEEWLRLVARETVEEENRRLDQPLDESQLGLNTKTRQKVLTAAYGRYKRVLGKTAEHPNKIPDWSEQWTPKTSTGRKKRFVDAARSCKLLNCLIECFGLYLEPLPSLPSPPSSSSSSSSSSSRYDSHANLIMPPSSPSSSSSSFSSSPRYDFHASATTPPSSPAFPPSPAASSSSSSYRSKRARCPNQEGVEFAESSPTSLPERPRQRARGPLRVHNIRGNLFENSVAGFENPPSEVLEQGAEVSDVDYDTARNSCIGFRFQNNRRILN